VILHPYALLGGERLRTKLMLRSTAMWAQRSERCQCREVRFRLLCCLAWSSLSVPLFAGSMQDHMVGELFRCDSPQCCIVQLLHPAHACAGSPRGSPPPLPGPPAHSCSGCCRAAASSPAFSLVVRYNQRGVGRSSGRWGAAEARQPSRLSCRAGRAAHAAAFVLWQPPLPPTHTYTSPHPHTPLLPPSLPPPTSPSPSPPLPRPPPQHECAGAGGHGGCAGRGGVGGGAAAPC
jgi:hypothetical protein